MATAAGRPECRKFAANIFTQSKCSNCFRHREEHTAQALDSSRATRKVAKFGYLFVAPGWDFSNPLNRTKRWQRRWFVLYDDGELSYSVDEHPDTVPQASIDMTKVLEVADAEEVTGNAYSLAITAPDRVHFVKGTCRDEARCWSDVLGVFQRAKGRHKRNATFPGGQSTSIHPPAQSVRADGRPRLNSCHTDPTVLRRPLTSSWLPTEGEVASVASDPAIDTRKGYREQPACSASPPTRDTVEGEEKGRPRRVVNRERRGVRTARSLSEDLAGMWRERDAPADSQGESDGGGGGTAASTRGPCPAAGQGDAARRILFDYDADADGRREEKLKDIADSITRPPYRRRQASSYHQGTVGVVKPTRDVDCSEEEPKKGRAIDSDRLVRGDPDGCGLDICTQRYSPSSELRVDLPSEDLLNIKKGWLMRQGLNKEWHKHWFVLRGGALMYYRDATAEDRGMLDGVIDLSGVCGVAEVQVARNYGFQTTTWDDRRYVLSAVTAGIRNNWMAAVRRAAGLQDPVAAAASSSSSTPDGLLGVISDKMDAAHLMQTTTSVCTPREALLVPSTPVTPRSILFSSDEEYRTASEGGRRESEDWGEALTPLPPSPPLNRTPISRVKEKARSRSTSRSRVYKRSRSSPPTMATTMILDAARPDDLLVTCCSEVAESDAEESIGMESVKSSLFDSADSQSTDMDELKRQLSTALCDAGNAERDVASLEKQVKDLLASLERTQLELEHRTQDVAELEQLRQSYKVLLKEHEELMARWRLHAVTPDWRVLYQQLQDRCRQESEEWQHKLSSTEVAVDQATQHCDQLRRQLTLEQETVQQLRNELEALSERLARGIEENECLYRRVRELEGRGVSVVLTASRERGRSVDSLSDLTNIDLDLNLSHMDKERVVEEYDELRGRFEKAVQEIRAMKRELRESHALFDELELRCITLRQDAKSREEGDRAQASLMASRIEDLTLKLSAAEKQVRGLKQKLAKSDSREKRRSLSLKGRESFQICKELEEKLGELEAKIAALETGKPLANATSKTPMPRETRSESPPRSVKREGTDDDSLKASSSSRLRRKSLDSATSCEPMKVLIRFSSLEAKVAKAAEKIMLQQEEEEAAATDTIQSVAIVNVSSPQEMAMSKGGGLKLLTDTVVKSRDKVRECLRLVSLLKNWSSSLLDHGLATEDVSSLEQRLLEVEDMLEQCCSEKDPGVVENSMKESVQCLVGRLEGVLRSKLSTLLERRCRMQEEGTLDAEAHVYLLAEKLAYESVVMQRVAHAISSSQDGLQQFHKWVVDNEVLESSRLMAALNKKLSSSDDGGNADADDADGDRYCCETSVEYLTRVLTRKLLVQRHLAARNAAAPPCVQQQVQTIRSSMVNALLKKQRKLDARVCEYRDARLKLLAQLLADETLGHTDDSKDTRKGVAVHSTPEERMIREAWAMAQEAVNRELIQAEISHVTMRCGQLYDASLCAEQEATLTLASCHRNILEQWGDAVQEMLKQGMESGIQELIDSYEDCMLHRKEGKGIPCRSHDDQDARESRRLLMEFADVTAHKALVDARIAVLLRESPGDSRDVDLGDVVSWLPDAEHPVDDRDASCFEEIAMGSRFESLFQQFAAQCMASIKEELGQENLSSSESHQESVGEVMKSLVHLEEELVDLCKCLTSQKVLTSSDSPPVEAQEGGKECRLEVTWDSVCAKCSSLRGQVTELTWRLAQGRECQRCQQLQEAVHRLAQENEEQLRDLQQSHEQEMVELRGELEQQQQSLVCQYEQEQAQLKERARRLERRLDTLDTEYTQQVDSLRVAYQKTLSSGAERDVDGEENIRQRYQTEIEQLRALCEKGLVAMDNSHRRIIAELKEKHRQDMEHMRMEKEQALAEETQATLAALDAMRKAHEMEVQKEIAKFKAEFMKKMQSTHDIGALHKEHEAEMEEIKKEILSLSEKYSIKCVESASLEEQLAAANKQLARARHHILHLDARNKQLRAHLVAEASESNDEAAQLLQQRDEEFSRLKQELNATRAHGDELSALCAHLCVEGRHDDDASLSALWDRLQQLASSWPPHDDTGGASDGPESNCNLDRATPSSSRQLEEPPALSNAELTRSPTASCTKGQSTFLVVGPLSLQSSWGSPLSGMVAQRKKLFEH